MTRTYWKCPLCGNIRPREVSQSHCTGKVGKTVSEIEKQFPGVSVDRNGGSLDSFMVSDLTEHEAREVAAFLTEVRRGGEQA